MPEMRVRKGGLSVKRIKMKKLTIILVAIVLAVSCLLFTACLSSNNKVTTTTLAVGEAGEISGLIVQLLSVKTSEIDDDDWSNYRAEDGKTYLFAEFKITNNRTEKVRIRYRDFKLVVIESGAEFMADYSNADNSVSSYDMQPYDEIVRFARFEIADVVLTKQLKIVFDSYWDYDDGANIEWTL